MLSTGYRQREFDSHTDDSDVSRQTFQRDLMTLPRNTQNRGKLGRRFSGRSGWQHPGALGVTSVPSGLFFLGGVRGPVSGERLPAGNLHIKAAWVLRKFSIWNLLHREMRAFGMGRKTGKAMLGDI